MPLLQSEISRRIAGARVDVRQLETGPAISAPVSVRILGPDAGMLLHLSAQLQGFSVSTRLQHASANDWGQYRTDMSVLVDPNEAAKLASQSRMWLDPQP